MMQRCSETLTAPSPDSVQRLLLVSSTAILRCRCETLQSAWLAHSQSLHAAESAMRRSLGSWQLTAEALSAHGDSDKPKHAVAVSRCPQSHICVGTSNIERVINYLEPHLQPTLTRMSLHLPVLGTQSVSYLCSVIAAGTQGRLSCPPVGRGHRRHGANPQSICESECPQKRPTLSRLQRRANYPEHRDERPSYPRLPPREYARVPIHQSGLAWYQLRNEPQSRCGGCLACLRY